QVAGEIDQPPPLLLVEEHALPGRAEEDDAVDRGGEPAAQVVAEQDWRHVARDGVEGRRDGEEQPRDPAVSFVRQASSASARSPTGCSPPPWRPRNRPHPR